MTAATFVVTSYLELQDKIGKQAARGEEVYQLKGGRGVGMDGRGGGGAARPAGRQSPKQGGGKAARKRK